MLSHEVGQVLALYPRIYFACHVRHVRDERSGKLLSAHQAGVLDHLDEIEPTGLLVLAKHMGVTASTMSLTVDRLVRGGYVVRERDAKDGRRVNLRLTKAGVRIKQMQKVLDPARVDAMLRHLDPAGRSDAIRGLELLARAANEEMHSQSSRGSKAAYKN